MLPKPAWPVGTVPAEPVCLAHAVLPEPRLSPPCSMREQTGQGQPDDFHWTSPQVKGQRSAGTEDHRVGHAIFHLRDLPGKRSRFPGRHHANLLAATPLARATSARWLQVCISVYLPRFVNSNLWIIPQWSIYLHLYLVICLSVHLSI